MVNYLLELERHGIDTYGMYGVDNVRVLCPFHGDEEPSAEVHTTRGKFYCFSCRKVASFAEFLAEVKGVPVADVRRMLLESERVSHVVENLEDFFFGGEEVEPVRYFKRAWFERTFRPIDGTPGEAYMRSRKLSIDILHTFGVRWGEHDEWEDRVIIPVRNTRGKLVTWAGRHVDGGIPKTRKPQSGREALFGLDVLLSGPGRLPYLILVEGEIDCMWLQQCGVPAVSTMGTSGITDQQAVLLYRHARRVVFAYDNDRAGRDATAAGIEAVRRYVPAFSVRLPEGRDPNDLSAAEVKKIFGKKFISE